MEIGGTLPAGGTISLTQPDGTRRTVDGRTVTLGAGSYTFRFEAPGYYPDQGVVEVRPGATTSWRPALKAVPEPEPPPPTTAATTGTTPPAAPAHDAAADAAAIEDAVRRWGQAFNDRDAGHIVPTLPANTRAQWQALLSDHRAVTEFHASVDSVAAPVVDGDRASVAFSLTVTFRSGNAPQRQTLAYDAAAQRADGGWNIVSLKAR